MKILYPIIDGEISGGNIVALRIIEEALRRGYEIIVNSPTEGRFTRILREKNVQVYNIDTRRTFRFDSAIKLACIIKQEGIDLLHSHTPLAGTLLARLAGWMTGVPVINHAHVRDSLNPNPFVKGYQFLFNWVTSRLFCAQIIAVSEATKHDIIRQGMAGDKITVIYNGIDLENNLDTESTAELRKEFALRGNQRIIGQVGRLCKMKGQDILIRAAQKVVKEFPEAVFMIVGEDLEENGAYRKKLEDLVIGLGLKEQIIFTGYRLDIMDLMHAFDIFVLPSSVEGFPVVILEAMAEKKPVITTSVGGNVEIVVDKDTGTLVPPEDPEGLAKAIIYHLKNPEISKKLAENGYNKVRQYFTLSKMFDKVMDVYREAIQK